MRLYPRAILHLPTPLFALALLAVGCGGGAPDVGRQEPSTVQRGTDVTSMGDGGRTALAKVIEFDQLELARRLLDRGADVDGQDADGWTPLMFSARHGRAEIAELLVERGADLDAVDGNRWTALMFASRYGEVEIAGQLVGAGADLGLTDPGGWNALLIALRYQEAEIAELLLGRGVDPHAQTDDGWTALLFAVQYGQPDVAVRLLESGADVAHQNANGSTALTFAAERGDVALTSRLIQHGADVNAAYEDGTTALMYSLRSAEPTVTAILIEAGADVNRRRDDGATALALAHHYERGKAVELLEAGGARYDYLDVRVGRTEPAENLQGSDGRSVTGTLLRMQIRIPNPSTADAAARALRDLVVRRRSDEGDEEWRAVAVELDRIGRWLPMIADGTDLEIPLHVGRNDLALVFDVDPSEASLDLRWPSVGLVRSLDRVD